MAEAAYEDVHTHGKVQGASTLTMQLARNLFLSSEKTYGRKLQEIFLALEIERRFTKDADLHAVCEPDLPGRRDVRL